jgi:hypothetical protein
VMSVLAVERRVGGGMAVGLFRKLFECQTKPQQGSCPSRALEGHPQHGECPRPIAACLFADAACLRSREGYFTMELLVGAHELWLRIA